MFIHHSLFLLLLPGISEGFTTLLSHRLSFTSIVSSSCSPFQLHNVPPKTINDADPDAIKDAANREPPPQSFYQLGVNSVRSAELAIADGNKLIEIEVRNLHSNKKKSNRYFGY
jgi:hypothetical protein